MAGAPKGQGLLDRARDAWRWRRGYAPPPWGIDVLITDACNLRCSYCPMFGNDAPAPMQPSLMALEDAERLLDSVASFRPMIRLFGGEPFIRREGRLPLCHRCPD